jgi:nucleotide-binding universal stress UspA family protein
MKPVVVGVDGSDAAKPALDWALAEAKLRGVPLRVVHAWHYAYATGLPFTPVVNEQELVEQAACQMLDELVEGIDASGLVDPIERRLVIGRAATALILQSEEAELVVVGARGLGGFKELVMGSVSSQVVHHASCPVVVVKASP